MSSDRRGQARTDAILDAALQLVQEIGYGAVTTDAIAARAQASKMTIYRKWPNKAALIADALRRQSEGPQPRAADTGSLRSDLLATVDAIAASFRRDGQPSLLSLTEALRADTGLRDLIRTQIEDRCTADGSVICMRAARRGEAPDTHLGPMALQLTVAHLLTHILLHGAPPITAERENFVDTVLLPVLNARQESG